MKYMPNALNQSINKDQTLMTTEAMLKEQEFTLSEIAELNHSSKELTHLSLLRQVAVPVVQEFDCSPVAFLNSNSNFKLIAKSNANDRRVTYLIVWEQVTKDEGSKVFVMGELTDISKLISPKGWSRPVLYTKIAVIMHYEIVERVWLNPNTYGEYPMLDVYNIKLNIPHNTVERCQTLSVPAWEDTEQDDKINQPINKE